MTPARASRREVGQSGEAMAERRLVDLGLSILERNWRCRFGEIDRIARDGDQIVFVEVKARRSRAFGGAEESISRKKAARLVRSAWSYLEEKGWMDLDWRIDVICIDRNAGRSSPRIEHFRDAIPEGVWDGR